MKIWTYLISSIPLMLLSCEPEKCHEIGHFDESVSNFEAVNSAYDDYNSTAPSIENEYLFHFSSNRKSAGNNFDIVGENMFIHWDKERGSLDITANANNPKFDYIKPMIDHVNTSCNELGPYSAMFAVHDGNNTIITDLTLFANDCEGNHNIQFTYCEQIFERDDLKSTDIKSPQPISFLNSESNDLYPTFFGENYVPHNSSFIYPAEIDQIIFCSDREGKFNMYSVDIPKEQTLIEILKSEESFEIKKLTINSAQDDKCPFVIGKMLVFSSNRAGGYGGYDLYYSEYVNGAWSEPENFGDHINTEFDEYRPIILNPEEFDNNLMIFSSNRTGGKGGFDLYHIGIPKSIP